MGIEDILNGLGYHGQDLEVAKSRLDIFNKTLSSLKTSAEVSEMFVTIGNKISLDSIFNLFKKWTELIVVEEKNIQSYNDALVLYGSSDCLSHAIRFYYSLFLHGGYISKAKKMIKTAESIRQRVGNSYNINLQKQQKKKKGRF